MPEINSADFAERWGGKLKKNAVKNGQNYFQ